MKISDKEHKIIMDTLNKQARTAGYVHLDDLAERWVVVTMEDVCDQWPTIWPKCIRDGDGFCMRYRINNNVCEGKEVSRPATIRKVLAGEGERV